MDIPTGWAIVEHRLMREFEFDDFLSAKTFVDAISLLAEDANHHPEIHFGWGYVVIELYTHDEHQITEKDLALALRINQTTEA
ncbi:4a-hydroxytetrahydrobiopterin dehydratase [Candidatus Poseidoniales archaeon]|jgi:4a-hydroxytetrahydrobiopterin dehydratase|nr:4a-hydroxytetrahydrobiopterin dehydratase [Candidatus Poseidoniales archaeon]MDB2322355.1 4a-hydroxytetrahydrobiopterin dehydratase [Candidatus Poseidoniales archaeon]